MKANLYHHRTTPNTIKPRGSIRWKLIVYADHREK
jgi:hypothetical protein